jgi:tripeptide aminopeptidase
VHDPLSPEEHARRVIERAVEVTEVPGPTGYEGDRAELVARWWVEDGWKDVCVDAVGNVWATAPPATTVASGADPAVLVAAHLDTVFAAGTPLEVRREGSRLIGPGIGDDGIGLAALSTVAMMAAAHPVPSPLYLVATVGEEGLGNLRGAREAIASPPGPLGAFIAVEGNYLGRVVTTGIGSIRWRVELSCPGGHAWERAGGPSAVHIAAQLVSELVRLPVQPGESSLNVGTLHGGEAINALGRNAIFELDVRAADPRSLAVLEASVQQVLSSPLPRGVRLDATVIGKRSAGRTASDHPLVRAAVAALEAATVHWREGGGSTDANAAQEAGLPAVALGVTVGAAEHTTEEWIETGPVASGLAALAGTIVSVAGVLNESGVRRCGPTMGGAGV